MTTFLLLHEPSPITRKCHIMIMIMIFIIIIIISPVSSERHIKEGFAEAGDDSGRPGPVSAEIHPDQDHGCRDLWAVRPPTLLPGIIIIIITIIINIIIISNRFHY